MRCRKKKADRAPSQVPAKFLLQTAARTILARADAVDAQSAVALDRLPALDVGQRLDRVQARVLGQRERDRVERRGEGAHGVLLDRGDLCRRQRGPDESAAVATDLVGLLGHGEAAGDLGRAAAVDDAVVADEVAHDAEGIVQCALGLVDDLRSRSA